MADTVLGILIPYKPHKHQKNLLFFFLSFLLLFNTCLSVVFQTLFALGSGATLLSRTAASSYYPLAKDEETKPRELVAHLNPHADKKSHPMRNPKPGCFSEGKRRGHSRCPMGKFFICPYRQGPINIRTQKI